MPFRFLHLKKDKLEKTKSKSKSTTDLLEIKKILNLDNHLISGHSETIKTKSKSKLSLFSIHKSSSSSTKEAKKTSEGNSRSSPGTSENKKRGSIVSHLSTETENSHTISLDDSVDSNNNSYDSSHDINALPTQPKQRSSSLCVISHMATRERKLSDLAQLDQYIEYHQRRMADDGSNATRLVCAQLLRQGLFKQLEQMPHGDLLQSYDKPYVSRCMSNVNKNNSSSSNNNSSSSRSSNNNSSEDDNNNSSTVVHFQKNKNNQKRRCSQWISPIQGQDNKLSLVGQERRGSWMSADPDQPDDSEQHQSLYRRDVDNHSFDNQYCGQERHHVDNLTTRDFLKMPKFLTKRRSIPSVAVSQIEIY